MIAPAPLAVLKKGLDNIRKQFNERRIQLQNRLNKKEKISDEDERWLDGEGNLVDEQQVIDELETASDYERGLGRMDEGKKSIVQRLIQLSKVKSAVEPQLPSKKRKRKSRNKLDK